MSVTVKSQLPDGFATIRTRGLARSKNRIDQQQNFRTLKSAGSGPLFENNNDLYYKSASTSLISVPPPVPPRTSSELTINSTSKDDYPVAVAGSYRDDDDIYYTSTLTYETFKPLKSPTLALKSDSSNYINLTQSTDYIDSLNYDFSLPPLKSPQYINELNLMRTRATEMGVAAIYTRSESPTYNKVRGSYRSTTPESLDNGSSNSSTYSHPTHANGKANGFGYVIQDTDLITTKPPLNAKSLTLQYRKSFNHSNSRSEIIYEEPKKVLLKNGSHSSDTDSGYDGNYMKIHKNASAELLSLDVSTNHIANRPNGYIRRYATLGHPSSRMMNGGCGGGVGVDDYHHFNGSGGESKSTTSLNERELVKVNLLDYKIGCQSTLRSKPVIPWYELAIKRDHRQSCPVGDEAHVVAAFEQSLANMTQRLQSLTATTEKKDSEILDMRQTIELLRKQSIQAGLTTAHMQSMGVQVNGQVNGNGNTDQKTAPPLPTGAEMQRHHSSDSMCSLNSVSSGCSAQDKKKKKGWLRSSFTKAFSRNAKISKTNRHVSQSSNLDQGSPASGNHHHHHHHHHHHGSNGNNNHQQPSTTVGPIGEKQSGIGPPNAQLPPPSPTKNGSPHKSVTLVENAKPIDAVELNGNPMVEDLKKQLREKDLVLTDIRLEALNSASQLECLKDTVMKMRHEMLNLKHNNERLQRLVTTRSLAGSEVSLGPVSPSGSMGEPRRYSLAADNGMARAPLELPQNLDETEEDNIPPAPAPEPPPAPLSPAIIAELSPTIERAAMVTEILTTPAEDVADPVDGKKIAIAVYLGQPESFAKYAEEMNECDNYYHSSQNGDDIDEKSVSENGEKSRKSFSGPPESNNPSPNEYIIAYTYISGKTTWQNLDYIVRKTFKDYLGKIDPGTNLGLNTDSITSYHLGEAKRGPEMGFPELLPCGYIIGNVKTLYICLQGVGSLAFESLILRNIVHRYISLLTEHRRLILCGPSGTGKSYLARKLAEFLVARSGRDNPAEAIATFNVDHKSSKELQQYLGHIAEQASMSEGAVEELPAVIILDNLHHASALGDVFSCLLSATAAKLPCIIGTMSQATCNTTNLQLHHNFRWVLTANHMEPVKGFLGRYLRRKLFNMELHSQTLQPQLEKVLKWLPSVWQHINSFLETHNSSDVTIGPRLFLSCPMNLQDSQSWFTDVWNYHLAPYLMDAVREGVQLYGRRGGSWVDPCTFVRETYPWPVGPTTVPQLRQITADDVGLEASAPANSENQDPLLNMLMRLQEAANYNGNQEPDSDCASLDSNMTHDSSAGAD